MKARGALLSSPVDLFFFFVVRSRSLKNVLDSSDSLSSHTQQWVCAAKDDFGEQRTKEEETSELPSEIWRTDNIDN